MLTGWELLKIHSGWVSLFYENLWKKVFGGPLCFGSCLRVPRTLIRSPSCSQRFVRTLYSSSKWFSPLSSKSKLVWLVEVTLGQLLTCETPCVKDGWKKYPQLYRSRIVNQPEFQLTCLVTTIMKFRAVYTSNQSKNSLYFVDTITWLYPSNSTHLKFSMVAYSSGRICDQCHDIKKIFAIWCTQLRARVHASNSKSIWGSSYTWI